MRFQLLACLLLSLAIPVSSHAILGKLLKRDTICETTLSAELKNSGLNPSQQDAVLSFAKTNPRLKIRVLTRTVEGKHQAIVVVGNKGLVRKETTFQAIEMIGGDQQNSDTGFNHVALQSRARLQPDPEIGSAQKALHEEQSSRSLQVSAILKNEQIKEALGDDINTEKTNVVVVVEERRPSVLAGAWKAVKDNWGGLYPIARFFQRGFVTLTHNNVRPFMRLTEDIADQRRLDNLKAEEQPDLLEKPPLQIYYTEHGYKSRATEKMAIAGRTTWLSALAFSTIYSGIDWYNFFVNGAQLVDNGVIWLSNGIVFGMPILGNVLNKLKPRFNVDSDSLQGRRSPIYRSLTSQTLQKLRAFILFQPKGEKSYYIYRSSHISDNIKDAASKAVEQPLLVIVNNSMVDYVVDNLTSSYSYSESFSGSPETEVDHDDVELVDHSEQIELDIK